MRGIEKSALRIVSELSILKRQGPYIHSNFTSRVVFKHNFHSFSVMASVLHSWALFPSVAPTPNNQSIVSSSSVSSFSRITSFSKHRESNLPRFSARNEFRDSFQFSSPTSCVSWNGLKKCEVSLFSWRNPLRSNGIEGKVYYRASPRSELADDRSAWKREEDEGDIQNPLKNPFWRKNVENEQVNQSSLSSSSEGQAKRERSAYNRFSSSSNSGGDRFSTNNKQHQFSSPRWKDNGMRGGENRGSRRDSNYGKNGYAPNNSVSRNEANYRQGGKPFMPRNNDPRGNSVNPKADAYRRRFQESAEWSNRSRREWSDGKFPSLGGSVKSMEERDRRMDDSGRRSLFDEEYGKRKPKLSARMLLGMDEEEEEIEEGERKEKGMNGEEGGSDAELGGSIADEKHDYDSKWRKAVPYAYRETNIERRDSPSGRKWVREGASMQYGDRRNINPMDYGYMGEGMEKWKIKVMEKRVKREEERRRLMEELEEGGEEWKKERLEWIIKEARVMKPAPLVRFLNSQRGWFSMEDVRFIILSLLNKDEGPRAVRVLKWVRQLDWYEPEFSIYVKLAEDMARLRKVTRALELYDMMIVHGMTPPQSTYEAIIKSLLKEGDSESLEFAWDMYCKMKQFAEYTPSAEIQKMLFDALIATKKHMAHLKDFAVHSPRSEIVLRDMQAAGVENTDVMYNQLCEHAGIRGDVLKAKEFLEEMESLNLKPSEEGRAALIYACRRSSAKLFAAAEAVPVKRKSDRGPFDSEKGYADETFISVDGGETEKMGMKEKDGQVEEGKIESGEEREDDDDARGVVAKQEIKGDDEASEKLSKEMIAEYAEKGLEDMEMAGFSPSSTIYISVMETLVNTGFSERVEVVWQKMVDANVRPVLKAFNVKMAALVDMDDRENAEKLLQRMRNAGFEPLHSAFNGIMRLYIRRKLWDDVVTTFDSMHVAGCIPDQESHRLLIHALVEGGKLDSARAAYDEMRLRGKVLPDKQTFEILINAYGDVKDYDNVEEIYKHMERALGPQFSLADGVKGIAQKAVGFKKVERDELKRLKLTKEQRETLIGLLLGGARIESHDDDLTYEVHFEQETEQVQKVEVLQHVYGLFFDWAQSPPQELVSSDYLHRPIHLMHFCTKSHGSFRFYAHQWWKDGRGSIPRLIHRWLSPRALAYWYMYGGRRCESTGGILLNAKRYTAKEIKLVVDALRARSMDCERRRGRSGDVIRFRGKSAVWLWKLMEPHILPSMVDSLKPRSTGGDGGYDDEVDGDDSDDARDGFDGEGDDYGDDDADMDGITYSAADSDADVDSGRGYDYGKINSSGDRLDPAAGGRKSRVKHVD